MSTRFLTTAQLAPIRREQLRPEYETFLQTTSSHLNYIRVTMKKGNGGYVLMGVHSYFGRYSFSIGPLGPAASGWMAEHCCELQLAGIKRIGVQDQQGYGGFCWFDVPR